MENHTLNTMNDSNSLKNSLNSLSTSSSTLMSNSNTVNTLDTLSTLMNNSNTVNTLNTSDTLSTLMNNLNTLNTSCTSDTLYTLNNSNTLNTPSISGINSINSISIPITRSVTINSINQNEMTKKVQIQTQIDNFYKKRKHSEIQDKKATTTISTKVKIRKAKDTAKDAFPIASIGKTFSSNTRSVAPVSHVIFRIRGNRVQCPRNCIEGQCSHLFPTQCQTSTFSYRFA